MYFFKVDTISIVLNVSHLFCTEVSDKSMGQKLNKLDKQVSL